MKDEIPLSDAMDRDEDRESVEQIIMLMRIALAPLFNSDPENIPMNQSFALTGAALFAGMTAGHMIALGTMKEQDKRRAGQVLLRNFRNGIELGKAEVRRAILEQTDTRGTA